MGIRILKSGLYTTVQDLGRMGYQSYGFSTSGVMDTRSFKIANILIDNEENEAGLEFTLIGPTLKFTSDTILAITGGYFQPKMNNIEIPMYKAIFANKGDILSFGGARTGSRGYISFSSKLDIPVIMGSRSTNTKCHIGGYKGRPLKKGDLILFREKKQYIKHFLSREITPEDFSNTNITLRVVLGPQAEYFTQKGLNTFLKEPYKVTVDFDRMGCRLDGPKIEYKNSVDIISDGIAFGAIQIPAHGKPIIMLADRQTTGGYAKIANIISSDLPKLAQSKPGDLIRFTSVTIEEAQQLIRDEAKIESRIRDKISKPCKEILEPRLTAKRLRRLFKC